MKNIFVTGLFGIRHSELLSELCQRYNVITYKNENFGNNTRISFIEDVVNININTILPEYSDNVYRLLRFTENNLQKILETKTVEPLEKQDVKHISETVFRIFVKLEMFKEYIKENKIDLFITSADYSGERAPFVLEAKKNGIPTLNISHGYDSNIRPDKEIWKPGKFPYPNFNSDYICMNNQMEKDVWNEFLDKSQEILPLGIPIPIAYDPNLSREKACDVLGINKNKIVITYCWSWCEVILPSKVQFDFMEQAEHNKQILLKIFQLPNISEVELIFKMHPIFDQFSDTYIGIQNYVKKLASKNNINQNMVFTIDKNPEVLAVTDLLVSPHFSSIIWEALIAGVPCTIVPYPYLYEMFSKEKITQCNHLTREGIINFNRDADELFNFLKTNSTNSRITELRSRIKEKKQKNGIDFRPNQEKCIAICNWIDNFFVEKDSKNIVAKPNNFPVKKSESGIPKVSIIIPLYNNVKFTRQCVNSIFQNTKYPNYEIILVDNGSKDNTRQYVKEMEKAHANIRGVYNDDNLRFARGCNAGAKFAKNKYICFLNNDTEVQENWMTVGINRLKSDENIGIVGAKLLYPNGTVQHCGLDLFQNISTIYSVWPAHRLRGTSPDNPKINKVEEFPVVTGACVFMETDFFNQIGCWDEAYGMYFEDSDLCFKVKAAGKKVIYDPKCVLIHHEAQSNPNQAEIDRLNMEAASRFYLKWEKEVAVIAIKKLIEKIDGKFVYLSGNIEPKNLLEAKKYLKPVTHHIASIFRELGPIYVHMGGIGDACLLLSSFYDADPEQVILSIPNSISTMKKFFSSFPKLKNVFFLPMPKNNISHNIYRQIFHQISNVKGLGATPKDNYIEEWLNTFDVFTKYNLNQKCEWINLFKTQKIADFQVIINPQGSMKGMMNGKKNIINPLYWEKIVATLNDENIKPIIIGIPEERDIYYKTGEMIDKRSYDLYEQMQLVASADLVIGADTWAKSFSALGEIPTIVFESLRPAKYKNWKDPAESIFIDPWKSITKVTNFENFKKLLLKILPSIQNGQQSVENNRVLDRKEYLKNIIDNYYTQVSIIIPLFNKCEYTKKCVQAIFDNTLYPNYEIIFINNASNDETREYIDELNSNFENIQVIHNEKNKYFAAANNQGVEISKGEVLVFLNNDTEVQTGWLHNLLKIHKREKNAGVIGAKLIYQNRKIQHAGIELLKLIKPKNIKGYGEIRWVPDHPNRNIAENDSAVSYQRDLDMVTGACLLISKKLFNEIGGFDEIYINGCEDIDLCLKIREMGKRVIYTPDSIVIHYEGKSDGRFDNVEKNLTIFIKRWYEYFDNFLKYRSKIERELLSVSEQQSKSDINVIWEGSQFVYHSLALVNREQTLRIINGGFNVSVLPYEKDQFIPGKKSPFRKIKQRVNRKLAKVDVHVRHQWPPNLTAPEKGHWVIIQPWEFGYLPKNWVKVFSRDVDEFWVPSNYVKKIYLDSGVPSDRVFVIPNGIDYEKFNPNVPPYQLKTKKKFKFLFLGGTIYRKGIDILLESYKKQFSSKDDVCLVIKDMGGDSFYRGKNNKAEIRKIQQDHSLPEIEYIDKYLDEPSLIGLYTACNCLVHPYRGEGFGLPILEAMSCGISPIVTRGGACLDFCNDENSIFIDARKVKYKDTKIGEEELVNNPWLFEPSIEDLAKKMHFAYKNPENIKKIGQIASKYAKEEFSWDNSSAILQNRIFQLTKKPIVRFNNQEKKNENLISEYDSLDEIQENYQKIKCPFCNSGKSKVIRNSNDIVQCVDCNSIYLRTRLTREAMEKLYQSYGDVDSHKPPDSVADIPKHSQFRKNFMNEILEFTKPEGKFLDIGCCWGGLLYNARQKGFDVQGIEVTRKNVEYAKNVLNINVSNIQFDQQDFNENSLNVVTMSHVFEHIPYTLEALKKINNILKPGGMFCGAVPNFGSFMSLFLKDQWFWLDPAYHYVHFYIDILKRELHRYGFKIEKIYTITGDYSDSNLNKTINAMFDINNDTDIHSIVELIEKEGFGEEIRFYARKEKHIKTTPKIDDLENDFEEEKLMFEIYSKIKNKLAGKTILPNFEDFESIYQDCEKFTDAGEYTKAFEKIKHLLTDFPFYTKAIILASNIHLLNNDNKAAYNLLEKSEKFSPACIKISRKLAEIDIVENKYEEAFNRLIKLNKSFPNDITTIVMIIELLLENDRFDDAFLYLKKAIIVDSDNIEIQNLIQHFISNTGSTKNIDSTPDILFEKVLKAKESGDIVACKEYLENILNIAPDYAAAYNMAGIINFEEGDLEKAIQSFSQAIENDHDLLDAKRNLAEVMLSKGDYEKGINIFDEILGEHPNDVLVLNRMGQLYFEVGKKDMAIKFINKVLEVEPDNKDALELLEILEKTDNINDIETSKQVPLKANEENAIDILENMISEEIDKKENSKTKDSKSVIEDIKQQLQLATKTGDSSKLLELVNQIAKISPEQASLQNLKPLIKFHPKYFTSDKCKLIKEIKGNAIFLSEIIEPNNFDFVEEYTDIFVHYLASIFESIGHIYVHMGGIGDACLLLSSFYDQEPEQIVLCIPNNINVMEQFFNCFPKLKKIFFLPYPVNLKFHGIYRQILTQIKNVKGLGATPRNTYLEEWTSDLNVFKKYGLTEKCNWVNNFKTEKITDFQVVINPKGSLKGMVEGKKNIIDPKFWHRIINFLNGQNIVPVIIGIPTEEDDYPIFGKVINKRSYNIFEQMQIVATADVLIGADTWGKSFSALGNIPTIVFESVRPKKHANWKDPAEYIFIDPWDSITKVKNVNEFRNRMQELLVNRDSVKSNKKPANNKTKISIVLTLYNNLGFTKKCIESIKRNTKYPNYEIVLVDDASKDSTWEYLKYLEQENDNVIITHLEENQKFAGGSNRGAEIASSEYLVFLNNDTEVEKNWLTSLFQVFQKNENTGIVGAKLLYPDRRVQHAGVEFVKLDEPIQIKNYGQIDYLMEHPNRYADENSPAINQVKEFDMVTGACLLIPTELFFNVGKFDEKYQMGVEDIDLCLKVRDKGYKILYNPDSVIIHHEAVSDDRFKYFNENLELFFKRWGNRFDEKWNFIPNEANISKENMILTNSPDNQSVTNDINKSEAVKSTGLNENELFDKILDSREKEDNVETIKLIETLLQIEPNHAGAFNILGIISYEQQELDNAIAMFQKSSELDPQFLDAQRNLAEVFIAKGEYEKGVHTFDHILENFPDDVLTLTRLAQLFMEVENFVNAKSFVTKILEIKPNDETALEMMEMIDENI